MLLRLLVNRQILKAIRVYYNSLRYQIKKPHRKYWFTAVKYSSHLKIEVHANSCDKSWCICQGCHNPAVLTRGQKVAFPSASSKAKIILWWTFYCFLSDELRREAFRGGLVSQTKKKLASMCLYHSCRILGSKKSIYSHQIKNFIILHI